MEYLGRARDLLIGRAIRWVAAQWARGRDEPRRQPGLRRALVDEVGVALNASTKLGLGMGSMVEREPRAEMAAAEGRVVSIATEVDDPELVSLVDAFIDQSRRWTVRSGPASHEALATAADAVSRRVRQLNRET